ncbi:uncharacterized protein LOC132721464 [Ruditapes philippinarum]|uniref:uncharacterized protein LOC132721464 n=1 Tax=Ruditapes philippinarum TaxID=129788 RepID=UPI00295BDB20|nr:uncharacterized protein LOC132721464 [Ruditapes philippinarum]
MDIDELCRHPEYRNYICCSHGLAYAGIKLEAYTRNGLKSIHRTAYSKLAGKQPCTQRCSEVYPRQISSWCETCRVWRKYLCDASNLQNIYFEKMMSWNWPTSYESITPYFLPQSWANQDFQDISTSCHIWDNCKNIFMIRQHVLHNLRECRNTFIAHNPRLRVTDLEKAKVFDALKDLFKDADVMLHIDAQDCLSELDRIEKGDMLSNSLKSIFEALSKHSDNIVHLQNIADRLMESQNDLHSAVEIENERHVQVIDTNDEIKDEQYQIQASVRGLEEKQNEMERNLRRYHERVINMIMMKEENIGNKELVLNFFMSHRFLIIFIAIIAIVLSICFNYYGYKD